jgi:hypothetical protein
MTERTLQPAATTPTVGLKHFQDAFAHALIATDFRTECAPEIAALVCQPGFSVYRNTVMKGCVDALQANYPSVAQLVGEEWFRAAAAIYVRANLPRHPMLADYGASFGDFLTRFEPAADLPYLAGVARLDRFWTEAHVARDEEAVAPAEVASLTSEELARTVLRPHAAARWAWFDDQPIFTIWRRNREPGGDDLSDIDWQGEGALVVRPGGAVEWHALDRAGCAFLDACAAGQPLGGAAAAALHVEPETDLAKLLARLLEAGAFGNVTTSEPSLEERAS